MTTPMPPPNLTQDEEAAVHVPFLIYVVWRPDYPAGAAVAEYLREHFTADRYSNITGGTGVPVLFSSAVDPQANTALHVDMNRADATAVVLLVDRDFARDAAWTAYIGVLTADTQAIGLTARMFPVAMEERALDAPFRQQALRWDRWEGVDGTRERRLVRDLTHEFSRMLRHHLAPGPHTTDNRRALQHYRQRVPVFLSHSKHDSDGARVANHIRAWLHNNTQLSSFLDVHDIPPGLSFEEVLEDALGTPDGIMIAIHTDTYSSREWCRREVICAKRLDLPMVVVDCLRVLDERSFPYLGNVPVVRMDPDRTDQLPEVVARLLEETFRGLLWASRLEGLPGVAGPDVFLARPPELFSLAKLRVGTRNGPLVVVYPDPPLGSEELQLFAEVASDVQLHSLTEWLGGSAA